jgi:hypothetical protein
MCRTALHEEGGAAQCAVDRLLELGSRSPRVAAATAVQLSALWLRCPAVAARYRRQLLTLLRDWPDRRQEGPAEVWHRQTRQT